MSREIAPLRDTGKDEKTKGCLRCNEEMRWVSQLSARIWITKCLFKKTKGCQCFLYGNKGTGADLTEGCPGRSGFHYKIRVNLQLAHRSVAHQRRDLVSFAVMNVLEKPCSHWLDKYDPCPWPLFSRDKCDDPTRDDGHTDTHTTTHTNTHTRGMM